MTTVTHFWDRKEGRTGRHFARLWSTWTPPAQGCPAPTPPVTAVHTLAYLSELGQLLLQVEELKHPQPQSNQGHQDHEKHHKKTQACAVIPLLLQRWQWQWQWWQWRWRQRWGRWWWWRWWPSLTRPSRHRGRTGEDWAWWRPVGAGTAVHPVDLGVWVVEGLLHGSQWLRQPQGKGCPPQACGVPGVEEGTAVADWPREESWLLLYRVSIAEGNTSL